MPASVAHIDQRTLELVAGDRKQIWDYDGNRQRHAFGEPIRQQATAKRRGLESAIHTRRVRRSHPGDKPQVIPKGKPN